MGLEYPSYFFDTYAFHELLNGNPAYDPFSESIGIMTTRLNLMELHCGLIRSIGKRSADSFYDRFVKFSVDISDDSFKEASLFRFRNRKKRLSYVDCVGYIIARKNNIPFLTGDKQFKGMEGVEFVK